MSPWWVVMKGPHFPIFAVAVGASLVTHALLWTGSRVVEVPAGLPAGFGRTSAAASTPITIALNPDGEPRNDFPLPDAEAQKPEKPEPKKPDDAEPELPKPPEAPKPPPKVEVEKYPDKIGKSDGTGIGTHEAKGPQPLQAREADNDQPNLSRDPRGPGMPDKPTPSALPPGDGGKGSQSGGPPAPPVAVAVVPLPPDLTPPVEREQPAEPESSPPPPLTFQPKAKERADQPAPAEAPALAKPPEKAKPAEQADPAKAADVDAKPGPSQRGLKEVTLPTKAGGIESDADKVDESAKSVGPLAPERPGSDASVADDGKAAPRAEVRRDGILPAPPAKRQATSPPLAPLPERAPPPPPPADVASSKKPKPAVASADPTPTRPDDLKPTPTKPDPQQKPDAKPPQDVKLAAEPKPAPKSALDAKPAAKPTPTPSRPKPDQPRTVVAMVVPPPPAPTATGNGGKPGARAPAADPAQESDSEVDAFSKIGTWTLRRDGSLPVQFGRQVKTVRPHLPIQAVIDAALGARSVNLRVHIGADGGVTTVSVDRTSGSTDLDQASLLAMYDWWFEPLKDKHGHPVPDVITFTLNYR